MATPDSLIVEKLKAAREGIDLATVHMPGASTSGNAGLAQARQNLAEAMRMVGELNEHLQAAPSVRVIRLAQRVVRLSPRDFPELTPELLSLVDRLLELGEAEPEFSRRSLNQEIRYSKVWVARGAMSRLYDVLTGSGLLKTAAQGTRYELGHSARSELSQ